MRKKMINSQLGNYKTYLMYLRQCESLAENVFEFKNLPEFIDISYLNKQLVLKGSVAFFRDEELGLLALPYVNNGNLDIYGRPKNITVISQNGYTKNLTPNEYVIMYDNNGRYPLFLDIVQYAERLSLIERTKDINISQQKTPRLWKTDSDHQKSLEDLINNVDTCENQVLTYNDIALDNTDCILEPAPFVADKLSEQKDKTWNEFLRLIGVSNLAVTKKERQISDEITAMQGGTIASRFTRFSPREKAIELINLKLLKPDEPKLEVSYYDGLPTTLKEPDENFDTDNDYKESEANDNVI